MAAAAGQGGPAQLQGGIAAMLAAQPSIQAASHEHDIQMWLMKRAKEQGIDITPPKDPGPKATPAMKEAYEAALDAHEEKLMALQTHAAIPESQATETSRKRRREDELNSLDESGCLFLTRFFRQPSDFIISTYPGSAVSPPSAAADSSPATRASSRARGRNGADSNAETADLYCPNTLVHFRRNVDFKRIASSSVWASLLEPADVPLARAQLVELMKMERNLLTFYKKHCQRYMAGVCLRLQQATARAEAGEEVCVLAALKGEVHALQMGLYINIPDDPTALPKFLVPYSKVTAGEAAAESGSDSDGLEVVEVDDAPPPHKAHAPATAVLLE